MKIRKQIISNSQLILAHSKKKKVFHSKVYSYFGYVLRNLCPSYSIFNLQFEVGPDGAYIHSTQVRGIGTDVAIIGSSVFIAQFFLSLGMGFIIHWYGSTAAVPLMCMLLSFFALIGAYNVVYLDM